MDSSYDRNRRNEFWADFAHRFEERMARRAERWQARAERRAARAERRWAGWHGMGPGFGGPGFGGPGFGPPPAEEDPALKARIDAMAQTIRDLTERVAVLERLSTDPEAKLREEIEKLRREDAAKPPGEDRGS